MENEVNNPNMGQNANPVPPVTNIPYPPVQNIPNNIPPLEQKPPMQRGPIDVEKKHSSVGPIISTIIIMILVLAGGFYLWGKKLATQQQNQELNQEIQNQNTAEEMLQLDASANAEVSALQSQGTSSDANAIDADLTVTNLENLDSDLNAIDQENF